MKTPPPITSRTASPIAGNTAALLAARVISVGVGLVTTPVLFAVLGGREFGVWALLLGLVSLAGLADLGFASVQVREVAQAAATGDARRARVAAALALLVFASLSLLLVAAVWVGWGVAAHLFHLGALAAPARDAAFLLVAAFAVDAAAAPWRAALEGSQRMRPVAVALAVSTVVGGALGVVLVTSGAGLVGLAGSALAASAVRAALLVGAAARVAAVRPSLRRVARADIRALLGYGIRVQATNVATGLNVDTDRFVLGAFFSPATVASFDVGSRLVGAVRLAPWHFFTALFPAATRLHAGGENAALDRLYLRATRYTAAFAGLTTAALVVSARPLVELWIGRPLPFAVTTIVVLAPAYALALTTGPAAALTRAENAPGRETRFSVLAAGVNTALTIPLLLVLGAVGVPVASSVAWVVASVFFFRHFHRASGRPLAPLCRAAWKPFVAAPLGAAAAWLVLGSAPVVSGRLSAATAAGSRAGLTLLIASVALAALRFFDADDRKAFRRLLARLRIVNAVSVPAPGSSGAPW